MNAKTLCYLGLIIAAASAKAYDVNTHAMLTYQAYLQSNLKTDPTLLQNLGLDYLQPQSNPFGRPS